MTAGVFMIDRRLAISLAPFAQPQPLGFGMTILVMRRLSAPPGKQIKQSADREEGDERPPLLEIGMRSRPQDQSAGAQQEEDASHPADLAGQQIEPWNRGDAGQIGEQAGTVLITARVMNVPDSASASPIPPTARIELAGVAKRGEILPNQRGSRPWSAKLDVIREIEVTALSWLARTETIAVTPSMIAPAGPSDFAASAASGASLWPMPDAE